MVILPGPFHQEILLIDQISENQDQLIPDNPRVLPGKREGRMPEEVLKPWNKVQDQAELLD